MKKIQMMSSKLLVLITLGVILSIFMKMTIAQPSPTPVILVPFASFVQFDLHPLPTPVSQRRNFSINLINNAAPVSGLEIEFTKGVVVSPVGSYECTWNIPNTPDTPTKFTFNVISTTNLKTSDNQINFPLRKDIVIDCLSIELEFIERDSFDAKLIPIIVNNIDYTEEIDFMVPAVDDTKNPIFNPFFVNLITRYDDSTGKRIINTKYFEFFVTLGRDLKERVTIQHDGPMTFLKTIKSGVSPLCTANNLAITTTYTPSGVLYLDFASNKMDKGTKLKIRCSNLFLDFRVVLGSVKWTSRLTSGDLTSPNTYSLPKPTDSNLPIDIFTTTSVVLEPHNAINVKKMTLKGITAKDVIQGWLTFTLDKTPILWLISSPFECKQSGIDVPAYFLPDGSGFKVDLSNNRIEKDGNMELSCNFYLDLSKNVAQQLYLTGSYYTPGDSKSFGSSWIIPSVNDSPDRLFDDHDIQLIKFMEGGSWNKRNFAIFAANSYFTINSALEITFSEPIIVQDTTLTPLKCWNKNDEISVTVKGDGRVMSFDVSTKIIQKGTDIQIRCLPLNAIYLDFSSHKGQLITATISSPATTTVTDIVTLAKVDDPVPEPAMLFKGLDVVMEKFKNFQHNLKKFKNFQQNLNKRTFSITATTAQVTIDKVIQFTISQPIMTKVGDVVCKNGDKALKMEVMSDKRGFGIDFSPNPVAAGGDVTIICTPLESFYLDFTSHRSQPMTFTAQQVDKPHLKSVAGVKGVDDGDEPLPPVETEWDFKLNIPIVTQYQPFITINTFNLPVISKEFNANVNEFDLSFVINGIKPRNGGSKHNSTIESLHRVTLISYQDETSTTPTTSSFSLPSIDILKPITITLKFPPNEIRYGVSIQIATQEVDEQREGIIITSFKLSTTQTTPQHIYIPQATSTTKWTTSPSITEELIGIEFGKYIGDGVGREGKEEGKDGKEGKERKEGKEGKERKEGKDGVRGPSFKLHFTNTSIPLINTLITLTTNSSLIGIEDTPVFWTNSYDNKPTVCQIPEFRKEVPVTLDSFKQKVTFNFEKMDFAKNKNLSFTIECPDIAIIVPQSQSPVEKVAFMVSVIDSEERQYVESFIGTPGEDNLKPKSKGLHPAIIVLIVIIILLMVVLAGIYAGKRLRFASQKKHQELIGNEDIDLSAQP